MHFLTSFLLTITLVTATAFAGDIPDYIGVQSFHLSDDSDYNNLIRSAEVAKVEVTRTQQTQDQLGEQVRQLEVKAKSMLDQMAQLISEVNKLKNIRFTLVSKLEELNKDPVVNSEAISNTLKAIADTDTQIQQNNQQVELIKIQIASASTELTEVQSNFLLATKISEITRQNMNTIIRQKEDYKNQLLVQIKKINFEGSRVGWADGRMDGADLAKRLGNELGAAAGVIDGQLQGAADGSARARIDGFRDGTKDGMTAGNRSAGAREGTAAGILRGNVCKVAVVGAGADKKFAMGNVIFTESLKKISKEFANGLLQKKSPTYPGDFNGPNYKPKINHAQIIMENAFADGYIFNYRQYARKEFQSRIDGDYNQSYENSYKQAANTASSANNDDTFYYEQGRQDADEKAYDRDYPAFKADAYKIAFDQFNTLPNKASNEFKISYIEAELLAYNKRCEEIRNKNVDGMRP
jgi:hypothetical protein